MNSEIPTFVTNFTIEKGKIVRTQGSGKTLCSPTRLALTVSL
jgi:hypothetical protein